MTISYISANPVLPQVPPPTQQVTSEIIPETLVGEPEAVSVNGDVLVEIHDPVLPEAGTLKSGDSGSIPIKMATAIYALNHSFDGIEQAMDLLV